MNIIQKIWARIKKFFGRWAPPMRECAWCCGSKISPWSIGCLKVMPNIDEIEKLCHLEEPKQYVIDVDAKLAKIRAAREQFAKPSQLAVA